MTTTLAETCTQLLVVSVHSVRQQKYETEILGCFLGNILSACWLLCIWKNMFFGEDEIIYFIFYNIHQFYKNDMKSFYLNETQTEARLPHL